MCDSSNPIVLIVQARGLRRTAQTYSATSGGTLIMDYASVGPSMAARSSGAQVLSWASLGGVPALWPTITTLVKVRAGGKVAVELWAGG